MDTAVRRPQPPPVAPTLPLLPSDERSPFPYPLPTTLIALKTETSGDVIDSKPLSAYENLVYQNMISFTNNILYYAKKGAAGTMTPQDSLHMKKDMQSLQLAMQLHEDSAQFWALQQQQQQLCPPRQPQQKIPSNSPLQLQLQMQLQTTQMQMQTQTHTHTHTQLQAMQTKCIPSKPASPPTVEKRQECLCCKTMDTPIWRKGPHGPATLCNACGLKYMRANKKRKKQSIASKKPLKNGVEDTAHRSNIYSILN